MRARGNACVALFFFVRPAYPAALQYLFPHAHHTSSKIGPVCAPLK